MMQYNDTMQDDVLSSVLFCSDAILYGCCMTEKREIKRKEKSTQHRSIYRSLQFPFFRENLLEKENKSIARLV